MADLVQMECLRGMTRAVRVCSDRQTGFLYFDQGQLVHAELGGLVGEPAALAMLSWETGTFQPSQRYFTDSPSIHVAWQVLLLMAAKEQDDVKRPLAAAAPDAPGRPTSSSPAADSAARDPARRETLKANRPPQQKADHAVGLPPGVVQALRFDRSGCLLASGGGSESFLELAAYATKLGSLIGESLGLPELRGLESSGSLTTLVCYEEEGGMVALEATASADLGPYRRKGGLR